MLERAVVVVAGVALLVAQLLTREREQRAHVLAEELHAVQVGVVPVALLHVRGAVRVRVS